MTLKPPDGAENTFATLLGLELGLASNIKYVYGAKGDAVQVTDAAMTIGTRTLSSATADFANSDLGKTIIVRGAGARSVTDGAITGGLKVLTSATAAFSAADVGKSLAISGAGAGGTTHNTQVSSFVNSTTVNVSAAASITVSGATVVIGNNLQTTISSVSNSTTVTLVTAATTTVSAATATFGTDDTLAFRAAATGGHNIYVPQGGYFVNGRVSITGTGQRWLGDGKRSTIYQTIFGMMTFDTSADETEFELLGFEYPHAKTARPAWTYSDKDAATNTLYNTDSTISRSAFIYCFGPSRTKQKNLHFHNVYTGVRMRSTNRQTTQASDNELLNIFCQHFQFGVIYMNQINGVIDGLHGADTDSTDTAPPHLLYCAGAGSIPEDVTVLGTAITADTADLFATVGGVDHYLSSGDIVAFNDLVGGGPNITNGTEYYVISSGLTTTAFKVSATPGGTAVDITVAVTAGEVTAYPDLDEDGDSDFANGLPDTTITGGAIRNCTDRNNPYSYSFKIRNARGLAVDNLTAYDSAGVLQCSWNQGVEFNNINGVFLRQVRSQSTFQLVDTGTQVGAQVNYTSHCSFKGLYLHTTQGQFVSGLGVRNNSRLNVFDHPHCDWTYGANTGNRSPYRLVDSNDNIYISPSWDSKGFDRAGFYFFNSDGNEVIEPRVTHATTTWQKLFNADGTSDNNTIIVDPDLTNISPLTMAGMIVTGTNSNIVKFSGAPRTGGTTVDFPSVANGAMTSTTVTVTGAQIGEAVAVGLSVAVPAGAILSGSVTAANTVTVTLLNNTGGPLDLASATLRASVLRAI